MDDKNIQKPTQDSLTQLKDQKSRQIDSTTRETVVGIVIEALKRKNPNSELEPEVERVAKRFEEKTFAAALNQKDYENRISLKLKEIDKIPILLTGAANSSLPAQANFVGSSSGENHGVVEPWRENTYKGLMAMRSKYTPQLEKLRNELFAEVIKLSVQGDNSKQRHTECLKGHFRQVGAILGGLNLSKDQLLPKQEERLGDLEKACVTYLNRFLKTPITSTSLAKDTQETISGAPSLPTYNDLEKEPSLPLFVIPPGILPPSLLEEYSDFIVIPPGISSSSLLEEYNNLEVIPPRVSPSSLLEEYNNLEKSLTPQSPIKRLRNDVSSSSQHALKSAVDDMQPVTRLVDRLEGSEPRPGSRSYLGQNLSGTSSGIGQTRRYITSVSTQMWSLPENPTIEAHSYSIQSLRKEVEEVNQKLIDTRVNICERKAKDMNLDSSGIVIECVFIGVSVTADLQSLILGSDSSSTTLVKPLLIRVPTDYPKSSPIVLDELIGDDRSSQVRYKLTKSLGGCTDPITVSDIARTWDVCAREVITELAAKYGGGTFSSRYGKWENC